MIKRTPLLIFCLYLLNFHSLEGQTKPIIQASDYGQWEILQGRLLSPNGQWVAYSIRNVDEKNELRIYDRQADTTKVVPWGEHPSFSENSRWLAYLIGKDPKGFNEQSKVALLDLEKNTETVYEEVTSYVFDEHSNYLALRGNGQENGNVLVVDLKNGTVMSFGNVRNFKWSGKSSLLTMIIRTPSGNGNGLHLYNPETASLQVLDASKSEYKSLSWRKDADDLAVLRSRKDENYHGHTNDILSWKDLSSSNVEKKVFDASKANSFPESRKITEDQSLRWAEDGSKIYFGTQHWEAIPKPEEEEPDSTKQEVEIKPEDISDVQIWHARDLRIIPMQESQASRDERRTLFCSWNLASDQFLQIGTDSMESVQILKGDRHAIETDSKPYSFGAMFGRPYEDIYLVDLSNGKRKKIIEQVRYFFDESPQGRYLLYFKGADYWVYDLQTDVHTNLTENLDVRFTNTEYDYPVKQLPPYYYAGWLEDETAVLVYDKYDIWALSSSGKPARKLTNGAKDKIVYRYLELDREAEAISPDALWFCSMYGDHSKKRGLARFSLQGKPKILIYEEQYVGSLQKAKEADIFLFRAESFSDSPDLFLTGPDFKKPHQFTETNPFQKDFAWGKAELLDFKSTTGRPLQAALYYPANYDPDKKYPMIVYNYEILSNQIHRYSVPSERNYYNFSVFTSQGYFVLAPDIVYRPRDPGRSAVEAIEGAVKTVIATGKVKPEAIGLVGHSWGGYQATYVPTQTDIFAASVAGAPITNFLSFMGAIHWNPGLPEVDHWETGQARMEVPYWEDFEAHVRNSPATFIDQLNTPMLMAFGNDDGVVDWHQGVEFYNFARRAGKKDFVLLVYPGEDHGIGRRAKEDAIDYHRRILEWFGHYLKGEEAPKWITEGISHRERQKEINRMGN